MNLENTGQSFILVDNKTKKSNKVLSIESNKSAVQNYFEEYVCLDNEFMQQIPVKSRSRDVLYIAGQSGSGKSTHVSNYLEQYHKMFKKRPVFLFSIFQDDKSLSAKYITRIKLDDKFISTELVLSDFQDSCVIYDDTDTIKNKSIRKKLDNIMNNILECGRHHNITFIYTSHLCNKGLQTKTILNESLSICIFPKTMMIRSLKYLLMEYFGLSKKQVQYILNLDTRSITIHKTYPPIISWSGGAYVIKSEL